MMRSPMPLLTVTLASWACAVSAQSVHTRAVQPTEPGVYQLAELFSHADRVGVVKVVSGTIEAYEIPIYKAQVEEGFKGLSKGETIYFGPYLGTGVGSEYIVFLRDHPKVIEPINRMSNGYGTLHYSDVFDEGYSSMLIGYRCGFQGPSEKDECGYGARVCTDYIKLPKSLPVSSEGGDDPPFGCRWVKRDALTAVLEELGGYEDGPIPVQDSSEAKKVTTQP